MAIINAKIGGMILVGTTWWKKRRIFQEKFYLKNQKNCIENSENGY